VHLLEDLEWQANGGHWSVGEALRVDDHQVAATLDLAVDDTDQVAVALGCARRTRYEAAFLYA
jgi:hypothetical protein